MTKGIVERGWLFLEAIMLQRSIISVAKCAEVS
jgi:hypothetical protein